MSGAPRPTSDMNITPMIDVLPSLRAERFGAASP
jgi:hypothetical protein